MWWLSFVLHEISFGFLSVFIPLYIMALGGSLAHIGLIFAVAIFLSIPASFLWGYLCNKRRRYKSYILLSFLFLVIILYAFTLTTSIGLLGALYSIMAFFHMAHEPPKNVLIAENYMRRFWERSYAFYEGVTEIGWLIGILVGLYASVQELITSHILLICSILNFAALVSSIFLIKDPTFIFERGLVKVERSILCAYRGLAASLRAMNGADHISVEPENSTRRFCFGLIAFFTATKMLFIPLPIFFLKELALQQSMVYALFCISTTGSLIGYFLLLKLRYTGTKTLYKVSGVRCALTLSLIAIKGGISGYGVIIPLTLVLFLLGLAHAIFHILSLSISMELLPENMVGMFNVVTGLGEAFGSLMGPMIAEKLGFTGLFLITGLVFFTACMILKR
ncbi:MAG: MFS transporter [Candidatus Bathyarchaeia archaeon]